MRRTDIRAGEDYFHQRSSYSNPARYRVVTTEPRLRTREGIVAPDTDSPWQVKEARGQVLVQRVIDGELGPEGLVATRDLRGPWEETFAAYEQACKDQATQRDAEWKARRAAQKLRSEASAAADRHDLDVPDEAYQTGSMVKIPARQLLAVLAALPEDWRYQPT